MKFFSTRGFTWGSTNPVQEQTTESQGFSAAVPWGSSIFGDVILTTTQFNSLQSQISELKESEAFLKSQLEHVDAKLHSAQLSGYFHVRTRWTPLPDEPPSMADDDACVNDWVQKFVALNDDTCVLFYHNAADGSPKDAAALAEDVVKVGRLAAATTTVNSDGEETRRHGFYILTRLGLRFEVSHASEIVVDSWLTALQKASKNRRNFGRKQGDDKSNNLLNLFLGCFGLITQSELEYDSNFIVSHPKDRVVDN